MISLVPYETREGFPATLRIQNFWMKFRILAFSLWQMHWPTPKDALRKDATQTLSCALIVLLSAPRKCACFRLASTHRDLIPIHRVADSLQERDCRRKHHHYLSGQV